MVCNIKYCHESAQKRVIKNISLIEEVLMDTTKILKTSVWTCVSEDSLKYLDSKARRTFFAVFLLIYIVAFFGNVYAIIVTYKRKHRFIQKTCIISLSLSDLIMATAYTINYLESFSHPLINWTLGGFMCSFIPMVQIFGLIASCTILVAIALDRYRNVVHALSKRWNPELWKCVLAVAILWIISAGIAYPMYIFFGVKRVIVVKIDEHHKLTCNEMQICITSLKKQLMIYYCCVATSVFLPLLIIFLWLYYNIAKLIWEHRKPLQVRFQKKQAATSMETSTSQIKSSKETSIVEKIKPQPKPQVKVNIERKIRTFKIIIALMLVFFLCRLPYWIFNIMKLVETYSEYKHWIITYAFNGLALLNCALNPFLYTFLNPTLNMIVKVYKVLKDFFCQVCCCCISNTEFEDFERENPFIVDTFQKKPLSSPPFLKSHQFKIKLDQCVPNVTQDSYKELKKY